MALTAEEPSVPQPAIAISCGPEDSPRTSTAPSEAGIGGLKTIHILKEWPFVTETAKGVQQLYQSLKTKSRVFNWSCALAEKSVHAVYERSTEYLPVLYPAVRLADFAASEVAEAVQKQLPLVRQPTSQVSETVRSGFSSRFAPLLTTIVSVLRIGKRGTRNATKRVAQTYKQLIVSVDKWMDDVEDYIENSKEMQVSQEQTQRAGARSLRGRALDVAATAALLYVGACCLLLSRLPVVGTFLQQQTPSPSTSKPASPLREPEPQSSRSSTGSGAEAETAEMTQEQRVKRLLRTKHSSREEQFEK